VDPDPHGFTLVLVSWIRILMGMRIWIQKGKNDQQNRKSEEISCSEVMDVLFQGLKASPLG
jgi:hypothetical protein